MASNFGGRLVSIVVAVIIVAVVGSGGWYAYNYLAHAQVKKEAHRLVAEGEYEQALVLLRDKILPKEGETEENLELLCRCYLGLGRPQEARQYAETLTRNFSGNAAGYVLAGEIRFYMQDYRGAVQAFQTALELAADDDQALVGIGKACFMLGTVNESERTALWAQAEDHLRRALEIEASTAAASRWIAELLLERGRADARQLNEAARFAENAAKTLKNDAQVWRVLGNVRLLRGDTDGAQQALEQAIALKRNDGQIHHDLGIVYFRQRNLVKASEHLGAAVKQQPGSAVFLLDFASCLAVLEDWEGAKNALTEATRVAPDGALPYIRLALAAFHNQDEEAAVANLRAALERAPNSAPLEFELGSIYYQTGKNEAALDYYARAAARMASNALANYNVGTMNLTLANFADAERNLTRAVEHASGDRSLLLDAMTNLGIAYFNARQPQKATEMFEKVLELDPDNVWGHINLGVGRARQNNAAEAIAHFQRAIQLQPEAFEAHLNLGLLYSEEGEFDKALASLQTALRLAPAEADTERVHMSLGIAHYQRGDFKNAQGSFNTVLASRSPTMLQRANLGLACVALKQKDLATAERLLNELAASPETGERDRIFVNQGILYAERKETKRAMDALEAALAQNQQMALAYYNRGVLRYRSGARSQETVRDFQQAYRENPQLAQAHYNLALTYEAQGDAARAEQEYRKALAVNERYVDAMINLALLRVRGGGSAEDLLERALQVNPNEPRVLLVRGYKAMLDGDNAGAIAAAQEALRRDEHLQQAYALLGYVYLTEKRENEAQLALAKALELDGEDAVSHLNYGRLLHGRRQYTEAENHLREARNLQPELKEVYYALTALYLDIWLYEEALDATRAALELAGDDANLLQLQKRIEAVMTRSAGPPAQALP